MEKVKIDTKIVGVKIRTLARRVNHSVEMRSWIKERTEMSVLCPAFFRRISNELS